MSFSYKDPLSLDNNRSIKWIDSTNTTRHNILTLDSSNNFYINPLGSSSLFIANNTQSTVFLGSSRGNNIVIPTKIGVGLHTDSNISANITLPAQNGYIGTNTSTGTNTGILGVSGGYALDNTHGSRILLYGSQQTSANVGNLHLYSARNGSINMFTNNDSVKFVIASTGNALFSPDGSTITLEISSTGNLFTTPITILDTTNSTGVGTGGSFTVKGGGSFDKDVYVGGDLTQSSDFRLKTNIRPINQLILHKILDISPVMYTDFLNREKYGFIAQDFKKDFPEMVKCNLGMYSLDYQKLTVLLWKSIQELYSLIHDGS